MNRLANPAIRNVLFDLGGVFYGVDYPATTAAFARLAQDAAAPPIAFTQAAQDPVFDTFECGLCSPAEFVAAVQRLLGRAVPEADVVAAWNAMLRGLLPGSEALLQALRARGYRLALFSNTNAIHWSVVGPQIAPLVPYFEQVFTSHTLHQRKPHPAAFRAVLSQLGWAAGETLFVDDSVQHVHGAEAAGLHAAHLAPGISLPELLG